MICFQNLRSIILRALTVFLAVWLPAGCANLAQRPVTHTVLKPSELGKLYSPEELRSDLNTVMETLGDVHPNLYAFTPKSVIDSARGKIEGVLTIPMTRIAFYELLAPLVALIGDGHTSIGLPFEEFSQYRLEKKGLAFPFNVAYDTITGVSITRNYTGDSVLEPGDRIISINTLSADSLARVFLQGFSGERMAFRWRGVAGAFRTLLWFRGIEPPYDLVLRRHGSGEEIRSRVEGVTLPSVLRIDSLLARGRTAVPNYRFERLEDGIGYIDFRSMSNPDEFSKFLSTTFSGIRTDPVRGLLIDLRGNGGGDSRLGSELLSYLTDSPYRMAQRKEWKMSAEYKSYMRQMLPWWIRWFPFTWVSSFARKTFGARDGEIVIDTSAIEPPDQNPLRYSGRTAFLIGPGTFSSAMMLANAVADYKLATLIGEETGGIPTAYGEVYSFDLPNTRLSANVSSAFFVRANGDTEDRRGIMPDIEVRQTEGDTRAGRNTVLERAREWVPYGR